VLLYDPRIVEYSLGSTTDQYGRFQFEGLSPGRYWLRAEANIRCYFNQQVKTGSSEVSDGLYSTAHVDHYATEERYFDQPLSYRAFIEVGQDGQAVELESELLPASTSGNVQEQAIGG
jgi:hypothetical protein